MLNLTLPGAAFAKAWHHAWLSTGVDEARPQFDHTVLLEVFRHPRCVQLVATDGYTLTGSTVPVHGHEDADLPEHYEHPDDTYIVVDHETRMATLMKWLLKDCKAAAKEQREEPTVHLAIKSAESPSVPTLDPGMDRHVLVVTTEREQLTLDIYGGSYPDWRSLILKHHREPTDRIAFNPQLLARLAKLPYTVELTLSGETGMAMLDVRSEPPVFGGIMPVRITQVTVPVEPDDDEGDGTELAYLGVQTSLAELLDLLDQAHTEDEEETEADDGPVYEPEDAA